MDVAITELEKIDATRVDGVGVPANGIPILLMKSVGVAKGARDCPKCEKAYDADHAGSKCENCGTALPDAPAAKSLPDWHADAVALVKKAMVRGKVDESADIDGGQQAIALLGKLIGYEAQELAAGNLGEAADIELLACAASMLRQWVSGESAVQDGNVMPATALMQSARALAEAAEAHPAAKMAVVAIDGRGATIEEVGEAMKVLAVLAELKKDRDYSAAEHPLDSDGDTAKSEIAKGGADVDTDAQGTGDLAKVVEEAVTKAVQPYKERVDALTAELAKVRAAPVPGGPMMSVVRPAKAADGEDPAKKAAYYEEWAERLSSPEDADRYRQLAAQERAKITS